MWTEIQTRLLIKLLIFLSCTTSQVIRSESLKIRSLIMKHQVVVGLIILLLVFYTFYRLLHVWLHTLNFSEVVAQSLVTSRRV